MIEPVSDYLLECLDVLGLPEESVSSEKAVKGFIFSQWGDNVAKDAWKTSTRGSGN